MVLDENSGVTPAQTVRGQGAFLHWPDGEFEELGARQFEELK